MQIFRNKHSEKFSLKYKQNPKKNGEKSPMQLKRSEKPFSFCFKHKKLQKNNEEIKRSRLFVFKQK